MTDDTTGRHGGESADDTVIGGRYRLIRRIGRGGMGEVWLAQDELLDRQVAVKRLLTGEAANEPAGPEEMNRLLREARLAARLNHPNAVAVFDVVVDGRRPDVVMEYVPGDTLADKIKRRGRIPVEEVRRIGAAIADALSEAHRLGIVHRDLKPANVLVTDRGVPKLADFGIARLGGDAGVGNTVTGFMLGTPAFLAPEIARGGNADQASDIWSLGITLYAALDGHSPFQTSSGDNTLAILSRVVTSNPAPPQHAGELTPVIMRLIAADPKARPLAHEAATLLRAPGDSSWPTGPPTPGGPTSATLPRGWTPAGATGAPAGFATPGHQTPPPPGYRTPAGPAGWQGPPPGSTPGPHHGQGPQASPPQGPPGAHQGPQGPQGPQRPQGPQISPAPQGPQGPAAPHGLHHGAAQGAPAGPSGPHRPIGPPQHPSGPHSRPIPHGAPPPKNRRRVLLVSGGAILALAAIITTVVVATSGGSDTTPAAQKTSAQTSGSPAVSGSGGQSSLTTTSSAGSSAPTTGSGVPSLGYDEQVYRAPGGIAVAAPSSWTADDSAGITAVRDFRAPGAADTKTGTFFRLGIGNTSPADNIHNEVAGTVKQIQSSSGAYRGVKILKITYVKNYHGTDAADIEFTGTNSEDVARHVKVRIWIEHGHTLEIELNSPTTLYSLYSNDVFPRMVDSCVVSG